MSGYYVASKAYNGYTLFAPLAGTGVWLIDMRGRFVHYWETKRLPGAHGILLPNGTLLYAGKSPDSPLQFGGLGGELMEFDWNGKLLWKYEDLYMHHDFQRLPNGNTVYLRWVKTPDDIARKVKGGIPGTELEGVMWSDAFREITPEGKVVWEWNGYEHLDPEMDSICPLCWRAEWTHANSCFVLPNGDILTIFLTMNEVVIIDRQSGKIRWRWGKGVLGHPHDPSMLSNGNILVFDNGAHRPSDLNNHYGMIGFSRVLEVDPKTETIVWEYKDESPLHFNASFMSGCQRLPNGNTLICEGTTGRFFEITPDKELVWEYVNPIYAMGEPVVGYNNIVFRAHRYGLDFLGFKGKTLDPDLFELALRRKPEDEKAALEKRLGRLGY